MHASVARSASSAASATSAEAMSSSPSSRRSVASAVRSRAASTTEGAADFHTAGTCSATSSWRKLKNVAVTTPAPTSPMAAARTAKYAACGSATPTAASSRPRSGEK